MEAEAKQIDIPIVVVVENGAKVSFPKGTTTGAELGMTATQHGEKVVFSLLLHEATLTVDAAGLVGLHVVVSEEGIKYTSQHRESPRGYCCTPVTPPNCGSQQACGFGAQSITCNGVTYSCPG